MRGHWLLAGAMAASLVTGACSSEQPPTTSAPASAPSQSAAPSLTPAPTLPMPSGATVALDPSLLSLLPASVAGAQVTQEPSSLAEAITHQDFVASMDRAVFPIAHSSSDIVSGVVAHVRPGVYSDSMFASWRASYDDGACAQSSGVLAHAEETLAGRTTYVTTCGGGLRVYHTYIASKGVIVSLLSIGSQDFGGQLMAGIQG